MYRVMVRFILFLLTIIVMVMEIASYIFMNVKFSLILLELKYSNENAKNVAKTVVILLRKMSITLMGIVRFIFENAIAI